MGRDGRGPAPPVPLRRRGRLQRAHLSPRAGRQRAAGHPHHGRRRTVPPGPGQGTDAADPRRTRHPQLQLRLRTGPPGRPEGSLGVSRIDTAQDIEAALRRVGPHHVERGVVVEEFLDGDEFSVEALSTGGRHRIIAVTRKFTDPMTFVSRGHVIPAPLTTDEHAAVTAYVTRVLDAFGFHDCPSHTEVMLTEHGPRIIEMHNRIGGDAIMDLVHLSTGVDMYDLVARQSIGEDIGPLLPEEIVHERSAAAWYAAPSGPPTRTLLEVQGIDEVRDLPHVRAVTLLREPGSPQPTVRHNFDRSGRVLAVGDSPREALHHARTATGMLRFVYGWTSTDT
ncbi:ATP-grasp domain-containing protein [Streptomyces sp. NPDC054835]|uniref:ATP-grasp domain-containing protein n=1 Tax=Streptomyces sp. NBC_01268 TaxID=2903806 RepID=UPI003FCC2ADB